MLLMSNGKRHQAYKPKSSQFARHVDSDQSSSDSVIKNQDDDSHGSQQLEVNDYKMVADEKIKHVPATAPLKGEVFSEPDPTFYSH